MLHWDKSTKNEKQEKDRVLLLVSAPANGVFQTSRALVDIVAYYVFSKHYNNKAQKFTSF